MPAPDWKTTIHANPRVVIVSAAIAACGGLIVSLACCFASYQAWTGGKDGGKAGGKNGGKHAAADVKKADAEVKKNAAGRDEFSLTDIEETRRWGKKATSRFKEAIGTGNELVIESEREKIKAETRKFIGKGVRWEFAVIRIERGKVDLSGLFIERKNGLAVFELSVEMNSLHIGNHITKDAALKLRPGDKVRIEAEIKSIEVTGCPVVTLIDAKAKS